MEFTADWHSKKIPLWRSCLSGLKGQPIRCLEIGSHEGRSAVWILENLLTHPDSTLTCVDPWPDANAERRYDLNVAETGKGQQARKIKQPSFRALRRLRGKFDLIYVDGSHEGRDVMEDAVLSFRILRKNGFLIFDDYRGCRNQALFRRPQPAIDSFLDLWSDCLEVLHRGRQVIVRKTDEPDSISRIPARRQALRTGTAARRQRLTRAPAHRRSVRRHGAQRAERMGQVSSRGFWLTDGRRGHFGDAGLAAALAEFFNGKSVIDFGCGNGFYVMAIQATGNCRGYDGNPHTPDMAGRGCETLDLSHPVDVGPADWVLSLEVGEHIPRPFEGVFIDNLHRHNRKGIVLSWARVGQGGMGHCNERNQNYLVRRFSRLGYSVDKVQTQAFRNAATLRWLRRNLLVLRRGR